VLKLYSSDREVELLVLRHELSVLRRTVKKPADRMILAALARRLPRRAWGGLLVRPETVLGWHRALVRRKWAAFGRRRGPGRPRLDDECRQLILRLAKENPRWGYMRIRGELLKLGYVVSTTSIRNLIQTHVIIRGRPHLEQVLDEYVDHYIKARPHRGLRLHPPNGQFRAVSTGAIRCRVRLGGLLREYSRTPSLAAA